MPNHGESSGPTDDAQSLTILQLIGNLDIGGAQEVVVTLAKALQSIGHRPVVCTLSDGPLRADIESSGIPVVCIENRRHSVVALPLFLADLWRLRRQLRGVVTNYDIDVVQTHLLRSTDFVVATLRNRAGFPLVYWTFHNFNFELRSEHLRRHRWLLRPKRVAYRWLYRGGSRWVDGLVAVSDEVSTAILSVIGPAANKIVVVPNGVDVDRDEPPIDRDAFRRQLGLACDAVVFTMVATFKIQKGHIHLLDAVAQLTATNPELRVLLVGDGGLRSEIEDRVRISGIDDVVAFLGSRRDVPELLSISDAFVLPSLWEGLPMALLEAMAFGLPCIATTVSGTKQVVASGKTGLLVPPGDVDALRDAMSWILADRARARAMGSAGRRRVERAFSARAQAHELVARFETDALGTRRPSMAARLNSMRGRQHAR